MKDADPRATARALIAQNGEMVTRNLIPLFHRTIEDLTAAGLDGDAVVEAAFTVALVHKARVIGAGPLSVLLRDAADHFERIERPNIVVRN